MNRLLANVMYALNSPRVFRTLHVIPSLPRRLRKYPPRFGMWNQSSPEVPATLRTVAGIVRDPDQEMAAFTDEPLHDFTLLQHHAIEWYRRHAWDVFLPLGPRLMRMARSARMSMARQPASPPDAVEPEWLKADLHAFAEQLGLSAIGVARFDPKYTFAETRGYPLGDRVIVCVLEENYDAMLRIPSAATERAKTHCYVDLHRLAFRLAQHLRDKGFRAGVPPPPTAGISIHYAVEAGLGQLGLNGQLLTPIAGSRCQLVQITTNAPLPFDAPVDYGVHGVCDACKVCVRRCPAGAIPQSRRFHRGVLKSKLNTSRCLPVVAQASGCAICMKVCPVQRYGLHAVIDEYERTGEILGKDTDELEGYDFAGTHYGPGERPRLPLSYFRPPGYEFDAARKRPLEGQSSIFG